VTADCLLFLDLNRNGENDFEEPGANGGSAIDGVDPGTYYAVLQPDWFAWSVTSPKDGVMKITLGPAEIKTLTFGVKT
jgi:hypothetical protein